MVENKGSKWVYETCFRLFIYDETMETLKKRKKGGGAVNWPRILNQKAQTGSHSIIEIMQGLNKMR